MNARMAVLAIELKSKNVFFFKNVLIMLSSSTVNLIALVFIIYDPYSESGSTIYTRMLTQSIVLRRYTTLVRLVSAESLKESDLTSRRNGRPKNTVRIEPVWRVV